LNRARERPRHRRPPRRVATFPNSGHDGSLSRAVVMKQSQAHDETRAPSAKPCRVLAIQNCKRGTTEPRSAGFSEEDVGIGRRRRSGTATSTLSRAEIRELHRRGKRAAVDFRTLALERMQARAKATSRSNDGGTLTVKVPVSAPGTRSRPWRAEERVREGFPADRAGRPAPAVGENEAATGCARIPAVPIWSFEQPDLMADRRGRDAQFCRGERTGSNAAQRSSKARNALRGRSRIGGGPAVHFSEPIISILSFSDLLIHSFSRLRQGPARRDISAV